MTCTRVRIKQVAEFDKDRVRPAQGSFYNVPTHKPQSAYHSVGSGSDTICTRSKEQGTWCEEECRRQGKQVKRKRA